MGCQMKLSYFQNTDPGHDIHLNSWMSLNHVLRPGSLEQSLEVHRGFLHQSQVHVLNFLLWSLVLPLHIGWLQTLLLTFGVDQTGDMDQYFEDALKNA